MSVRIRGRTYSLRSPQNWASDRGREQIRRSKPGRGSCRYQGAFRATGLAPLGCVAVLGVLDQVLAAKVGERLTHLARGYVGELAVLVDPVDLVPANRWYSAVSSATASSLKMSACTSNTRLRCELLLRLLRYRPHACRSRHRDARGSRNRGRGRRPVRRDRPAGIASWTIAASGRRRIRRCPLHSHSR